MGLTEKITMIATALMLTLYLAFWGFVIWVVIKLLQHWDVI